MSIFNTNVWPNDVLVFLSHICTLTQPPDHFLCLTSNPMTHSDFKFNVESENAVIYTDDNVVLYEVLLVTKNLYNYVKN